MYFEVYQEPNGSAGPSGRWCWRLRQRNGRTLATGVTAHKGPGDKPVKRALRKLVCGMQGREWPKPGFEVRNLSSGERSRL